MKRVLAVFFAVMSICLIFAGCGGNHTDNLDEKTYYTVTFKQEGEKDVKVKVECGKGIAKSKIPKPIPLEDYSIEWEDVDLSEITSDITVNAIKTYIGLKITLVYGDGFPKELITVTEIKVKTGQKYSLPELEADPVKGGYEINAWRTEDGTAFPFSGVYTLTESITLEVDFSSWW